MMILKQVLSWFTHVRQPEHRDVLQSAQQSLSLNTGHRRQSLSASGHANAAQCSRDFQRQVAEARTPIRWYGDLQDIYLA